jgi:hypothetical protein
MKKHLPGDSKAHKGKQRKHRPVIIQGGTTNPMRSRIQRKIRKRRTGGVK